MDSLRFEILKKSTKSRECSYLYLFEDKQLFTIEKIRKKHTTYKCRNRSCGSTLSIKNSICTRLNHTNHTNHLENSDGEKEYLQLKAEIALQNSFNQKQNETKTARKILNEQNIQPTISWKHKFYRLKKRLENKNKELSSDIVKSVYNRLERNQTAHIETEIPSIESNTNINTNHNITASDVSYSNDIVFTETSPSICKDSNTFNSTESSSENTYREITPLISDGLQSQVDSLLLQPNTNCIENLKITNTILMGALTTLNTRFTNSFECFEDSSTVSHECSNSQIFCPTLELTANNIEPNGTSEQNTQIQQNKQNEQTIEIETIFIHNHKKLDNLPTEICTDPLSPSKLKNFTFREIISIKHLNDHNLKCKICNENWSKIALFPCLDTVCETCWSSTNKKAELDIIINKKIKSRRLIEKALRKQDCVVCKQPIEKHLRYMI